MEGVIVMESILKLFIEKYPEYKNERVEVYYGA